MNFFKNIFRKKNQLKDSIGNNKNNGMELIDLVFSLYDYRIDRENLINPKLFKNIRVKGKSIEHKIDIYIEFVQMNNLEKTVIKIIDNKIVKAEDVWEFDNLLKDLGYFPKGVLYYNSEIDEKLKTDQSKYPPIWLAVNVLTFGQMVNMLELMSVRNLSKISNFFNCDNSELISWLKCINLVRNICAHNSNIIDFKFKTVPQLKDEWKNDLYELKPGVYSNRIALPFLIISYMMNKINPKYHFSDIVNSLDKLIKDDDTAKYYGFKSISTMESIKSKWNKKPRIRRRTR